MVVRRIFQLGVVATVLVNLHSSAEENSSGDAKCQFGKTLRKQVNAEPLNGTCLRDIVVRLSNEFRSITDVELGLTSFQQMLDAMEFTNTSSSLNWRLNLLGDKLNNKLLSYVKLLRQSNNILQPILAKNEDEFSYPGSVEGLDIVSSKLSDFCLEITQALAIRLRNQEFKNMHVLPFMYPTTVCGPFSSDHNIGPLLLSQYCPKKNVLLLFEHGMFMSEGDITLAQITAERIIDMLSQMDYINVVGLSSNNSLFCKDGLLKATDVNKFQLARYIHSLSRTETNETIEFDFDKLLENVKGEVVFIHLTNTLKTTSHITKINNMISVGKVNGYLRTILILSDQEPHSNIKEYDDNIVVLPTQNILAYEISRLFSNLKCSDEHKRDYYLSDPYFDLYSKTMTVSIGQITDKALISLDIQLRNFIDDIIYFNAGSGIYPILFDNNGIVWVHKDFPRMETIMEQPLKVKLQHIENISPETVTMMIEQYEGVLNVKTRLREQKWYRWKHLTYKNLIICIVSTSNESTEFAAKLIPMLPTNILHHRLDLLIHSLSDKGILCTNNNKLVTLSTGVVYLSPWCFQSPMEQLKLLDTGSAVTMQSYMAYIKDLRGLLANPGLRQSVKPDVAVLTQTLEYFKDRHIESPLNKFIIRRYITGTMSGVLEVYPGIMLDTGFDPKRRMWYGNALEHPRKLIFTPPYLGAGGSGYVVTLSQTVHMNSNSTSHNDAIAVLSMDVTMGFVSRLLKEMFPFCNESTVKCFLMDDKGYLVSHPALLEPLGKVEQQHLTHKELLVANDILNHELFVKKKACTNYLNGTVQRYYQFNTSLDEVLTNIVHGEHCVKYQVAAVPGTNVFLGVVNVTCNLLRAFCPCSIMDRSCLNCKRMEQTECECPCECALYFSSCADYTTYNVDNLEPCPVPYEQGGSSQVPYTQSANVRPCPSIDCKLFKTENECLGIVGCQWCHVDNDGETPLHVPFCNDMLRCFRGVLGSSVPLNDGTYNSQSTEDIAMREWPSVGPVAGGILAFLLILGVILFCYRLRSVQSGLEHQCLHIHTSPDMLRMTHLEGDAEPIELDQAKNNLDSLIRDGIAPISPYRVSTNYRKPPGGDSDHGYSTMTPHDDSEQQTFAEPQTTHLGSPHHVLAPVTVHCNMEANYC
ncbi:PREDICTED: LOW QUALITY PROTEIN: VWFA and cache domain-containing protein 1 [Dufourea novaeangliae]|uniref:LOW QUALITY PROTEIN: VWFA and cache domain-containing protein 1 n=1 Tax=Dufourea novaeangliae TaxID=178035 RepID=UPI0007673987|nr:PREDICTED: LOW QUALITY PROTEIN: VWFA and cache domain-containing protein 1 [Dufourea novaeangliae]